MTRIFSVSHNTFESQGLPWIQSILSGFQDRGMCSVCGAKLSYPCGDLVVGLEQRKAKKWPDVLGCGAYPLLIVSGKVLEAWKQSCIKVLPASQVIISTPIPSTLPVGKPNYFWIGGTQYSGTMMDFDASGYVGVQFCPECGNRAHDIKATYDRQHGKVWPYKFKGGSWTGADLFTTDLSPTAFFCTDSVIQSAGKNHLTNFRFVPVEEGSNGRAIEYINKT